MIRAAALAVTLATAVPGPAPGNERVCNALATIAASSVEARLAGVPVGAWLVINDHRAIEAGTNPARREMIRRAVYIGYRSRTPAEAERATLAQCIGGSL